MTDFHSEWAQKAESVNREIQQFWNQRFENPLIGSEEYIEALKYSTLVGGKRFRPLLTLKTGEALGLQPDYCMPYALAVEFIHCFSLVHDDLPCMDDDDFRRGFPTLHKKFDEATALLAGDGLMLEATELLASSFLDTPRKSLELIQCLMKAAGSKGMVAGQIIDLKAQKEKLKLSDLEIVHRHKTGALIRASVEGACILAEVSTDTREKLNLYAESLGLAFQIKDDLLELEEGKKELGSYPGIIGEEASRVRLKELVLEGKSYLEELGSKAKFLEQIIDYNFQREK